MWLVTSKKQIRAFEHQLTSWNWRRLPDMENRSGWMWIALLLLTLLAMGSVAQKIAAVPASERLTKLRRLLREARDKNEWETYRSGAEELKKLLNGSSTALIELARADLQLGRKEEARTAIQNVLAMGLADDRLTASPFDALPDVVEGMAANRAPISVASLAWELPDSGLLPEDIDYDPVRHRFLVTSVLEEKIIALDADGKTRDFAPAPDKWPMLAIKIDPKRSKVWATEVAMDGFTVVPKAEWGRAALVCYELESGKLLSKLEFPQQGAPGDMVLMPDGSTLVADGKGGGIYRVEKNTWKRVDGGEFISPQTPALDADGRYAFIPDYLRGIGILDLSNGATTWLPMANKFALQGIDGLYRFGDSLLAVQNGTSPERVIRFRLERDHREVVSQQVFESHTPTLGDPTHGVVVGSEFYYIANSGWDMLDDHGQRTSNGKVAPARIMRVRVEK